MKKDNKMVTIDPKVCPGYEKMIAAEKTGGIEASTRILTDLLHEKRMSYNELIIAIQE